MHKLLVAAAALVIGSVGYANAAVLGSTSTSNDVLGVTEGYFGANLFATNSLTITFTLVGYEAGAFNSFQLGSHQISGGGGQTGTLSSFALPTQSFTTTVGPGLIDFSFLTSINGGSVANGANPLPGSQPNFFVSFGTDPSFVDTSVNGSSPTSGRLGVLGFDDGGGSADGDFDDLVIAFRVVGDGAIVTGVPELSTWAMLVLGFGGLGLAGAARSRRLVKTTA